MSLPSPEQEFAAAKIVYPMNAEAMDLRIVVAKDAEGRVAHIRWRRWPDSDASMREEHWPHWAVFGTDEMFEPIAWAPSCYGDDDIAMAYHQ